MADEPIDPPPPEPPPIEPPSAEPPPGEPGKPGNGNDHEPETITERVRRARQVIPVGDRGVTPTDYAQWIDIAKDVCRAYLMLPKHLHDNPPVMAGLLEIAARFKLSAYMLASKTYVQNDRLCFESQAFGAILYASGLLRGRLRFEFHGEGEDTTCIVSGTFVDDPDTVCMATSPPLKLVHPGRTQKEGRTYVKGSPLWDKDPEQQLAYFAQRRWIRRYAPDCCAGMYTKEEMAELDDYRVATSGAIPLSSNRLGQVATEEGWREGRHHAELELAATAPEPVEPEPPEPSPVPMKRRPAPKPPAKSLRSKAAQKPAQAPKTKGKPGRPPTRKPHSGRLGRPPSRADIKAVVKRAESPPKRPTPRPPRWLDYVTRSEAWIGAIVDAPDQAEQRWDREHTLRDQLQVPMGERSRLRAMLERKLTPLRAQPAAEEAEQS